MVTLVWAWAVPRVMGRINATAAAGASRDRSIRMELSSSRAIEPGRHRAIDRLPFQTPAEPASVGKIEVFRRRRDLSTWRLVTVVGAGAMRDTNDRVTESLRLVETHPFVTVGVRVQRCDLAWRRRASTPLRR